MKLPHQEFIKYKNWESKFLEDYQLITSKELEELRADMEKVCPEPDDRLLRALIAMGVGGYEKRLEDPEVKYWTYWAGLKTYNTFNRFPQLSDVELAFLFYAMGKLFVPLLLHERGVKSESFKGLSMQDKEKAVMDELEVIWENHLIRILQILPFLSLNSNTK